MPGEQSKDTMLGTIEQQLSKSILTCCADTLSVMAKAKPHVRHADLCTQSSAGAQHLVYKTQMFMEEECTLACNKATWAAQNVLQRHS